MSDFKRGDLVRYGGGITALARLISPHHNGWHAYQCCGGIVYISTFQRSSESDVEIWWNALKWRTNFGREPDTSIVRLGPLGGRPPVLQGEDALKRIAEIIESVDSRCLLADGPVPPTLSMMEQKEISAIYALSKGHYEDWIPE